MQDHIWVVERFHKGKWHMFATSPNREDARIHARCSAFIKTRIRKFVAE